MLLRSSHLNNRASKKLKAFFLRQKLKVEKNLSQRYLWIWLLSHGLNPSKIHRKFTIFKENCTVRNTASLASKRQREYRKKRGLWTLVFYEQGAG